MHIHLEIKKDVYDFHLEYSAYRHCFRYRDLRKLIMCIAEEFTEMVTDSWVQSKKDWFRRVTPEEAWFNYRESQGVIFEELFTHCLMVKLCKLLELGFTEWKGAKARKLYEQYFPEGFMVSWGTYMSITIKFTFELWRLKPRPVRRHEVLIFRDLFARRKYTCPIPEEVPESLIRERMGYIEDLVKTFETYFPEYLYSIDILCFQQLKEIQEEYRKQIDKSDVYRWLREHNLLRRIDKEVRYIDVLEATKRYLLHSLGNRAVWLRNYARSLIARYGVGWHVGILTRSLIFLDFDSKTLEAMEELGRLMLRIMIELDCNNFIISETANGFHLIAVKDVHKTHWFDFYRSIVLNHVDYETYGLGKPAMKLYKYVDFLHAYLSLRRGRAILRVTTTPRRWIRLCAVVKDRSLVYWNEECPAELKSIILSILR